MKKEYAKIRFRDYLQHNRLFNDKVNNRKDYDIFLDFFTFYIGSYMGLKNI